MKTPPGTGLLVAALLTSAACGPRDVFVGNMSVTVGDTADVATGSTVLVAIVNPVVNSPHDAGVPGEQGSARDGIDVEPEPGGAGVTVAGLAIVDVPVGSVDVRIGPAALALEVEAAGDVFDALIAFDGERAAYFVDTPVRYPVGEAGGAVFFDPDVAPAELAATLAEDDAIVVLRAGVYVGDLEITGRDVLVFGEDWADSAVVVDGSLAAQGNGTRVRGVTITGELAAKGADLSISFSRVLGATKVTGNGGVFVRNVFCGSTALPKNKVTMLDNHGVAPLETLPPGACDL